MGVINQGQAVGRQVDRHLLVGAGVVVDDGAQGQAVADDEEAGRDRPDEQGQGDDDVDSVLADQGFAAGLVQAGGLAAQPPGGQAIGQGDLHRGPAVAVGQQAGSPESGVGELSPDLVLFALQGKAA